MPEGGLPYLPFPYAPEENFTPPVPGDISGGIVAAPGAGSALDQVGAVAVLPPPVEQQAALPVPADIAQRPAPSEAIAAQTPAIASLPAGTPPPPPPAVTGEVALPPPVPISQREYLREAPLEALPRAPEIEKVPYPDNATPEQNAAIDAVNQERQMLADVGHRAEVEQSLRAATAAAQSALTQDALTQRAQQLEQVRARREQQLKRREEVAQSVEQDYEELRRLAKEKLPEISTGDKLSLVAVAAAGAINAALNGVQPGQATGTAFQQIIERRAKDRAQEIAGLEKAVGAGEQQLGLLDRATQQTEYFNDLAKAELYEEVAITADAMAKKATSNEERFRLSTAATDARARAQQAIAEARRKEEEYQLKLSKEQREADAQAEKLRQEAEKISQDWKRLKDEEAEREAQRKAREAERQGRLAEVGKERTIVTPVGDFQVRNPQVAAELTKKLTAGQEMIGLADKIMTRRRNQGIEWTKSAEGQKMLADYGKLLLASKNFYELGALAGPDVEVIERVIGGDPNAIISMLPLLEATRENILTEMNLAISSNLVDPEERARFKPWQPAPPEAFTPSAEQATTTIRTGSVDDARGAAQEIIAAAKRDKPKDWAETAYRSLYAEKLALQDAREGTSGKERREYDQKINAIRKALDAPEAELGRRKMLELNRDVLEKHEAEQEKVGSLRNALGGILGVKRSELTQNPYQDAINLYRRGAAAGDSALTEAVLQSLREAGYTDLQTFLQRARSAQ